jgi:hypothetical protein
LGEDSWELRDCNSLIRHIPAATQANAPDGNENAAVAAIDQRSQPLANCALNAGWRQPRRLLAHFLALSGSPAFPVPIGAKLGLDKSANQCQVARFFDMKTDQNGTI